MERMINNKYKMQKHTVKDLLQHGFRPIGYSEDHEYSYRFPAYKYNKKPVLFASFIVCSDTGEVLISVQRSNGYTFFPFYVDHYGNYDKLLESVQNNIKREAAKLGIIKIKENRRNKDDERISVNHNKKSRRKASRKKHKE